MAFSIPIVKKDYDIYNSNKNRQRRLSDCSNSKSQSHVRAKSSSLTSSSFRPQSKSVGHSSSATPIDKRTQTIHKSSSHVTTPTRRYSGTQKPSFSSSSSHHHHHQQQQKHNIQKSKSLHQVDHKSSNNNDQNPSNSLVNFHVKLLDQLKKTITCSSSKKSSSGSGGGGVASSSTYGHSSKSTGQLEKSTMKKS